MQSLQIFSLIQLALSQTEKAYPMLNYTHHKHISTSVLQMNPINLIHVPSLE